MNLLTSNPRAGKRGKFFYLFVVQVALLVLYPYVDTAGWPLAIFRLLSALTFVSAIYAVSDRQRNWVFALLLALPAGVLNTIATLRPDLHLEVAAFGFAFLFLVFTLVTLLRAVVSTREITSDTIYGAISVYLLIAMSWAVAYVLLSHLQPGALSADAARHPNHVIDWSDCLFFSFVTLTSTGYGDIVPVTAQARSLASLEAVSGTMYMAVLVARLVGVYTAAMRPNEITVESTSVQVYATTGDVIT
jgi:hypothetical protein